jgi:hypothetical protein
MLQPPFNSQVLFGALFSREHSHEVLIETRHVLIE